MVLIGEADEGLAYPRHGLDEPALGSVRATVDKLAIEAIYPADAATAAVLRSPSAVS